MPKPKSKKVTVALSLEKRLDVFEVTTRVDKDGRIKTVVLTRNGKAVKATAGKMGRKAGAK